MEEVLLPGATLDAGVVRGEARRFGLVGVEEFGKGSAHDVPAALLEDEAAALLHQCVRQVGVALRVGELDDIVQGVPARGQLVHLAKVLEGGAGAKLQNAAWWSFCCC